jgi:hypothetical protein
VRDITLQNRQNQLNCLEVCKTVSVLLLQA